jgi:uncharacterized membrane protein YqaE (UPF0057 family)
MRKYGAAQIIGFVPSLFLLPVDVWFTEGLGIDFWINFILCRLGFTPGPIHSAYSWVVLEDGSTDSEEWPEISKCCFWRTCRPESLSVSDR